MVLQDMSSRQIMQTFMQTSAPTVATVPFYNTAEDIQKTIGFRTGTHTCSLVVRAQNYVILLVRHSAGLVHCSGC